MSEPEDSKEYMALIKLPKREEKEKKCPGGSQSFRMKSNIMCNKILNRSSLCYSGRRSAASDYLNQRHLCEVDKIEKMKSEKLEKEILSLRETPQINKNFKRYSKLLHQSSSKILNKNALADRTMSNQLTQTKQDSNKRDLSDFQFGQFRQESNKSDYFQFGQLRQESTKSDFQFGQFRQESNKTDTQFSHFRQESGKKDLSDLFKPNQGISRKEDLNKFILFANSLTN